MRPKFLMLAAALICAAWTVSAQQELVAVKGKVTDRLTNLPVVGARVIVERFDRPRDPGIPNVFATRPASGSQDPAADRAAVLTGEDGRFQFALQAPVGFHIFVDASGYVRPFTGVSQDNTYEIKTGASVPEILIRLSPALTISGRVTDSENRLPQRGLKVRAHAYRPAGPGRMLVIAAESNTGEDGRFSLERLGPGEYYVEVRSPLGAGISDPKRDDDFLDSVITGYAPTWYPGAQGVEGAAPVAIWDGAAAQDIEIRIRKMRLASIRGRIIGDGERGGVGEVSLALVRSQRTAFGASQTFVARGKREVGSEFQIDRVPPGRYWLVASTSGSPPQDRCAALRAIDVGERNQQGLDLDLAKGITVTGRVHIEGIEENDKVAALPADNVRLVLEPLQRVLPDSRALSATVRRVDGRCVLEGVFPDQFKVRVVGVPSVYDVAEVRYNGGETNHGIVTFGQAMNHKLDITLAPANASISVTVADGSQPAAAAEIVLLQEPINDAQMLLAAHAYREARTNEDGKATISHVLPGRYRIAAFPDGVLWAEDPYLGQYLTSAKLITTVGMQETVVDVQVRSKR